MDTYTITINTTINPHSTFTVEVNAPDMEEAVISEWPGAAAYVQEQYAAATAEERDRFDVWVQVADEDEAYDVPFVDPFETFDLPRPPHRTPMLIDAHTGDELRPATPEQIEASNAAGVYGYIYVDHEGNVVPHDVKDTPGWDVSMVWVSY